MDAGGIMGSIIGNIHELDNFSIGGSLLSMGWIRAPFSFFNVHACHLGILLKCNYDSVGLEWTLRVSVSNKFPVILMLVEWEPHFA